jgi:hypothetical protein
MCVCARVSSYYNGMDAVTRDRFITRIGRHGKGGHENYVFLLLDTKDHGVLSLECDHVPVDHSCVHPSAKGLTYECIEPLKRWKLRYKGEMTRGLRGPDDTSKGQSVFVELELEYEAETPLFWYMRDDNRETLAKNLSQEPWGMAFVNMCLNRTNNHGHYEDFGRCLGTIKVADDEEACAGLTSKYDFGTFRDHSWDIRMWATMDKLFILLLEMPTPLSINGKTYDYLDLTLVDMPKNAGGVQVRIYVLSFLSVRQSILAPAILQCVVVDLCCSALILFAITQLICVACISHLHLEPLASCSLTTPLFCVMWHVWPIF